MWIAVMQSASDFFVHSCSLLMINNERIMINELTGTITGTGTLTLTLTLTLTVN